MKHYTCRNILSFDCKGVFTIGSGESAVRWVRTQVHGQSFLLNQIRKMIGLAVAVYRGTAPADAIDRALDPCVDLSTPMAPELGLFLAECMFGLYNEVFGNTREPLRLSDWAADVEAFKLVRFLPLPAALPAVLHRVGLKASSKLQSKVYPALVARDRAEAVNYRWLQTVTDKRFLFSSWAAATPVRKLKRPRARAS